MNSSELAVLLQILSKKQYLQKYHAGYQKYSHYRPCRPWEDYPGGPYIAPGQLVP
jgi:hypothetical protein